MAFGNKLLGQTLDTIVPADYGLVLLTLSAAVFLVNAWMSYMIGEARRRYKVPYPNVYADPAKNEDADAFNRIQRGHQNTLESMPAFVGLLTTSGLKWPRLAAGIGFAWIVCRVLYFQGYRHSVKGRMTGVGHFFCLMALTLLNIVWGVQLLHKGYFRN